MAVDDLDVRVRVLARDAPEVDVALQELGVVVLPVLGDAARQQVGQRDGVRGLARLEVCVVVQALAPGRLAVHEVDLALGRVERLHVVPAVRVLQARRHGRVASELLAAPRLAQVLLHGIDVVVPVQRRGERISGLHAEQRPADALVGVRVARPEGGGGRAKARRRGRGGGGHRRTSAGGVHSARRGAVAAARVSTHHPLPACCHSTRW